jgi:hypothetical protein
MLYKMAFVVVDIVNFSFFIRLVFVLVESFYVLLDNRVLVFLFSIH